MNWMSVRCFAIHKTSHSVQEGVSFTQSVPVVIVKSQSSTIPTSPPSCVVPQGKWSHRVEGRQRGEMPTEIMD